MGNKSSKRSHQTNNNHSSTYEIGKNCCNSKGSDPSHYKQLTLIKCIPNRYINCGEDYTIYTGENGICYGVGNNSKGQLGVGDFNNKHNIRRIIRYFHQNNINIHNICTKPHCSTTFWITDKGDVYGNGCNIKNELGLKRDRIMFGQNYINHPLKIDGLYFITDIQSGFALQQIPGGPLRIIKKWISYHIKSVYIPDDILQIIYRYNPKQINGCMNAVYSIHFAASWRRLDAFIGQYIIKMACTLKYCILLESNGTVWKCDINDYPIEFYELFHENKNIIDIECGRDTCLALNNKGNIYLFDNISDRKCVRIKELKDHYIEQIKCGAYHFYARSRENKHFLWGTNEFNECLCYDDETECKEPYCINEIVEKETNGKRIQNVFLGNMCTKLIVT